MLFLTQILGLVVPDPLMDCVPGDVFISQNLGIWKIIFIDIMSQSVPHCLFLSEPAEAAPPVAYLYCWYCQSGFWEPKTLVLEGLEVVQSCGQNTAVRSVFWYTYISFSVFACSSSEMWTSFPLCQIRIPFALLQSLYLHVWQKTNSYKNVNNPKTSVPGMFAL